MVRGSRDRVSNPPVADSPKIRVRLYGFPPLQGSALLDVQRLNFAILLPSFHRDWGHFICPPLHTDFEEVFLC